MANYKCQQKTISVRILVACEYSGIVRDAFAAKGHDAWSCDVLPTESPGNHIQDDVLNHLNKGWDMMIAHPPCTYLSNAGARFLFPKKQLNNERYTLGIIAKKFFMELYNANINKVVVENPIPSKIFKLPKYNQIIQPYEYGHPVQKRTCLWLKNVANLVPTDVVTERESTKIPGNWFNKGGKERQKNRAKFWPGMANAMADQWS